MRASKKRYWADAELVLAAVDGDVDAAGILFARYEQYARAVARSVSQDPHIADEALAAAEAKAFEKMAELRDPTRFGPWLAAMVRNSAADEARRRARAVPSGDLPDVVFDEADSPELDSFRRARSALLRIPERHRRAIDMVVVDKLPINELAADLQIDTAAAYQLLDRGRRSLRRAYVTPRLSQDAPTACRACARRTVPYLRGDVTARAAVDAHVAGCLACRARLAETLDTARHVLPLFGPVPLALAGAWRLLRRAFQCAPAKTVTIGALALTTAGAVGIAVTPRATSTPAPAAERASVIAFANPVNAAVTLPTTSVPSTPSSTTVTTPPLTGPGAGLPGAAVPASTTTASSAMAGAPPNDPAVTTTAPPTSGPSASAPTSTPSIPTTSASPPPAATTTPPSATTTVPSTTTTAPAVVVSIPGVPLPPVTIPQITVPTIPSVSVPGVPVTTPAIPSVSIPGVPITTPTLPSVSIPGIPITTPAVSIPTPTVPTISVP